MAQAQQLIAWQHVNTKAWFICNASYMQTTHPNPRRCHVPRISAFVTPVADVQASVRPSATIAYHKMEAA